MKNEFNVHFNLMQSKILTEAEYTSLKLYLFSHHTPNHQGNKSRGVGDIFDLNYVIETHSDLEEKVGINGILFPGGFEIAKRLFNDGIAFVEVNFKK